MLSIKKDVFSDELILKKLTSFFGFKQFKGNQKKVIESIIKGHDTFVIMPTGGGKSLCYQLPAILLEGVAIVVSPLIALMKNQVDSMRSYSNNENIAHFFNSTLNKKEVEHVQKSVLNGTTKLLFVAPETINKETNISFFKKCKISFFAIDEAHCISEWGHDFRPEYRKLKKVINTIGRKPIIALTATATEKIRKDIAQNLGVENNNLFISSFNRPNLYYEIRKSENTEKELVKFIKEHCEKAGIIYCLSRKKAEEISELLNLNEIKSLPYHAGLERKIRIKTQDDFLLEKINVIVATIAFGMGIDKPDVRYVIHYNLPKSLENYYQETGRSGRDGGEGRCILFYNPKDVEKFQKFNSNKNVFEKEIAIQLLDEMVSFIENTECRRKKLLHYFGEEYNSDDCNNNCDNCKSPKKYLDKKSELASLLQMIHINNNKLTKQQLISILNGQPITSQNKLTELKLLGTTKNLTEKSVKQIVEKAIIDNFLKQNLENPRNLIITSKGESFLKNPDSFLINETDIESSKKDVLKATSFNVELFKLLKNVRKQIADEKKIPPFIIFQDPSLEEMALNYPINLQELQNITGVGKGKAEKYGVRFIQSIQHYVQKNKIERVQDYTIKSKPKKNDLKIFIIQSTDRQISFDDIVEQRKISIQTLISEFENIVNAGTKVNIDYHINTILDDQQQKEIYEYFLHEANTDSVNDAIEYFDQDYEELEIRLMKIKFFSELAN